MRQYIQHSQRHPVLGGHSAEDDLYIVKEVVDKYIYGYPWHLPGSAADIYIY